MQLNDDQLLTEPEAAEMLKITLPELYEQTFKQQEAQ